MFFLSGVCFIIYIYIYESRKGNTVWFRAGTIGSMMSTVTDADFVYIVLRRLLRSNLGSLSPNTRCPVRVYRSTIDADHLESCSFSRIMSKRSDAFKAVVIEMFVDAGVSFDQCDC